MDITLLILSILTAGGALVGTVIPVVPGAPLAYAALLLLHFTTFGHFSVPFLIVFAILTVAATMLDNLFTVLGAQKFGGTKRATIGALIGLLIGIFFVPPFGMIAGAFLGALIGELTTGKEFIKSLKASFGTFIGFITGVALKSVIILVMIFYYIMEIIQTAKA